MADRVCHGRGRLGLERSEKEEESRLGPPWSEEKSTRSDRTLVEREARTTLVRGEGHHVRSDMPMGEEPLDHFGPRRWREEVAWTTLFRGGEYQVRSDLD